MSLAEEGLVKVPTGIQGLDELLFGGTLPSSSIMIEGEPGSGKSTMAMQFLLAGIDRSEPGVYITMEESPARIYRDAISYGWDFRRLERENKLRVIATSPESLVEQVGKGGPILEAAHELGARRVVVDSVTVVQSLCTDPTGCRPILSSLIRGLEREGLRVFLVRDLEPPGAEPTTAFWASYSVDTLVSLMSDTMHSRLSQRLLRIRKSRGQDHVGGLHGYKISDSGVEVFPRTMPAPLEEIPYPPKRLLTGVPGLDEMLAGGYVCRQPVLATGPTGTGKTILAMNYLAEGTRQEEPGLLITTEETPAEVIAHGESVGIGLSRLVSDGLVDVEHVIAPDVSVDELMFRLRKRLEARHYARVAIDSLTAVEAISPDLDFTRDAMEYMVRLLDRHEATLIMTYESPTVTGSVDLTRSALSPLAGTILLLRLVEIEGDVKKAISVLKHRGSRHATDVRQTMIDESGMRVLSGFRGYQGVLTGIPAIVSRRPTV